VLGVTANLQLSLHPALADVPPPTRNFTAHDPEAGHESDTHTESQTLSGYEVPPRAVASHDCRVR
jgi:hypothetical protein